MMTYVRSYRYDSLKDLTKIYIQAGALMPIHNWCLIVSEPRKCCLVSKLPSLSLALSCRPLIKCLLVHTQRMNRKFADKINQLAQRIFFSLLPEA